nr:MEDS domain-containing protein [Deltaproteobacteria bacterium]
VTHIPFPLDTHWLAIARDDGFLAAAVAEFVRDGLERREAAVLVASARRWRLIRAELEALGDDVSTAMDDGKLVILDTTATLGRMSIGGQVEPSRLATELLPVIDRVRAANDAAQVRVYSEFLDALWSRRSFDLVAQLENAWHELLKVESITLLCAYNLDPLDERKDPSQLMGLCRAHGHVHAAQDSARRGEAIRRAMDDVLGIREVGRLQMVLAAAGLPSGDKGTAELTLLWLRTQVPHLAHRVLIQTCRLLEEGQMPLAVAAT